MCGWQIAEALLHLLITPSTKPTRMNIGISGIGDEMRGKSIDFFYLESLNVGLLNCHQRTNSLNNHIGKVILISIPVLQFPRNGIVRYTSIHRHDSIEV